MRNLLIFVRIRFIMQTNAFLYYLSKLPIIKLLIPQNIYRYALPKILVSLFGFILDFIKNTLVSNLGAVLAMYWMPRLLMRLFGRQEADNVLLYTFFFVTVSCLLPAMEQSKLFTSTRDDILFLNHFMMDPEAWYHQKIINILWKNGVLIAPALIFVFWDAYFVFCLVCVRLATIAISNYVYLVLFNKKSKLPDRKSRWSLSILCTLALYCSCFFIQFQDRALSPWILAGIGVAALAICAAFCIPLFRFRDYKTIAVEFASKNTPVFDVRTLSGGELDAINLKEEDEIVYTTQFNSLIHLGSWDYFDKILKRRMAKAFRNQRKQTIIFNTIFALAGGLLFRFKIFGLQTSNLLHYSSFVITTVIGMTYGHSFLELCFRNMDAPLLYHRFYDAATIRMSFLRRFRYLMLNGLFLLGLALADVCVLLIAAGTWLPTSTILVFGIVFAIILFVFETIHLIAYYLIQPYTTDCTVKSPLFTAVNTVEGLLTYGILFIRGDITNLLLPIAILALLALGGFLTVLRVVPHTFKIRS